MKITPYELLELVSIINNPSDTIQMLNDLMGEIDNNPSKYINKLSEEIEEFAKNIGICPLCGDVLISKDYKETRGEYFGFDSEETMYSYECFNPECSYTEE